MMTQIKDTSIVAAATIAKKDTSDDDTNKDTSDDDTNKDTSYSPSWDYMKATSENDTSIPPTGGIANKR